MHRQLLGLRQHPGRQTQPRRLQGRRRGISASRRSTSPAARPTRSTSWARSSTTSSWASCPRSTTWAARCSPTGRPSTTTARAGGTSRATSSSPSSAPKEAAEGYCLYKVGCRGPETYNNCSIVKFNGGTSWPVQAGHPCIGCSQPDFWDKFTPFYEEM
ncbi:MAG: hypothetical protein MZV70_06825 [Desulfobacterales bacterium]|nr:hypothetical protein [Desulfobacterales bacterium]